MARSEHLPIYKAIYDLCLYFEEIVRNFSRYHKYSLGGDLRDGARSVLKLVVRTVSGRFCIRFSRRCGVELVWFEPFFTAQLSTIRTAHARLALPLLRATVTGRKDVRDKMSDRAVSPGSRLREHSAPNPRHPKTPQ
jgi:hypothetical protein